MPRPPGAWEAYLAAEPQCAERAEICYRIGRLHMQAEQFGPAAAALVRAEQAAGDDKDLKVKIGPRIVECLNRLGRYGEVGRELSRRVEAGVRDKGGEKPGQRVLATLTGQNLTEADLDRIIERQVDRMLAMEGIAEPQQRQALLQQMSTPSMRQGLLRQFLMSEVFCRRARELGLDREQEYQQARDQALQDFMAGQFLEGELEKINPTPVDLESYFKAHASQYETPESLEVVTIRLDEKEDAAEVLKKIASAEDFRKLAAERQPPGAGQKSAGRQITRSRKDPELGDVEALFALDEGQWTTQPHVGGKERFLVLVEKKTRRRTPQMQDVLDRVRADYSAQAAGADRIAVCRPGPALQRADHARRGKVGRGTAHSEPSRTGQEGSLKSPMSAILRHLTESRSAARPRHDPRGPSAAMPRFAVQVVARRAARWLR